MCLGAVLEAHSIDISGITNEAVSGLPIDNGKVDGSFQYTKPSVGNGKPTSDPKKTGDDKGVLTLDQVKGWSPEQINKNWDKVSNLMSQQTR